MLHVVEISYFNQRELKGGTAGTLACRSEEGATLPAAPAAGGGGRAGTCVHTARHRSGLAAPRGSRELACRAASVRWDVALPPEPAKPPPSQQGALKVQARQQGPFICFLNYAPSAPFPHHF